MSDLSPRQGLAILFALLCAGVGIVLLLDPVAQSSEYHRFADGRSRFGIPNFNDVFSNLGFAIVGLAGIHTVEGMRRDRQFQWPRDARPYWGFFVGVALISLGSGYYHLDPSNERLLWDRLPMAVAFMAFFSAIIADRIDARSGNGWLLALLITLGCASVIYWAWTEGEGRGDLRFYALVQFYPVLVLPLLCWLFPQHRYTRTRYFVWVFAWYGLSKALEHADHLIFELTGQIVSGHSLKHLAAAVATFVVLRMLLARDMGVSTGSPEQSS